MLITQITEGSDVVISHPSEIGNGTFSRRTQRRFRPLVQSPH